MTLKDRITKAARACVPLEERVAFPNDDEDLFDAIVDLRTPSPSSRILRRN